MAVTPPNSVKNTPASTSAFPISLVAKTPLLIRPYSNGCRPHRRASGISLLVSAWRCGSFRLQVEAFDNFLPNGHLLDNVVLRFLVRAGNDVDVECGQALLDLGI